MLGPQPLNVRVVRETIFSKKKFLTAILKCHQFNKTAVGSTENNNLIPAEKTLYYNRYSVRARGSDSGAHPSRRAAPDRQQATLNTRETTAAQQQLWLRVWGGGGLGEATDCVSRVGQTAPYQHSVISPRDHLIRG